MGRFDSFAFPPFIWITRVIQTEATDSTPLLATQSNHNRESTLPLSGSVIPTRGAAMKTKHQPHTLVYPLWRLMVLYGDGHAIVY